jgi:hypothetical protein
VFINVHCFLVVSRVVDNWTQFDLEDLSKPILYTVSNTTYYPIAIKCLNSIASSDHMLLATGGLNRITCLKVDTVLVQSRSEEVHQEHTTSTCKTLHALMFSMLHSTCRSTVIIVTSEEPMHRSSCSVCCCGRCNSR